ncbi:MAG: electron transfer flavoprotein subunit beta/FixA family protein [Bacteroidales bacterium]|nr:electron transfer flavoprotein subunit beta/FixA family protein [Bacteroidales bacterium]
MNIAVCVKPVPDSKYYDQIKIDPVTKTWDRSGIPTVISDLDKHALEAAISIKEKHGGKVAVFTMAPPTMKDTIMQALGMGANEAYLISDRAFAGSDTLATSNILAAAIRKAGNFDLVITGNESDDGSTAQVSAQLGEWLEMPHVMNVTKIDCDGNSIFVTAKQDNGSIDYEIGLPAVVGVTRKVNKPRFVSIMGLMKAKQKPFNVFTANDIEPDPNFVGLKGSPTQPGGIASPEMGRKSEKIDGTPEEIAKRIVDELYKAGIK